MTTRLKKPNIAFFGCTNAGKSSLINAICNQNVSIVSPLRGTTTDSVSKALELLPFGPVNLIDTAGMDDYDEISDLKKDCTKRVLDKTDVAILVINSNFGFQKEDLELKKSFEERKLPFLIVFNKSDEIENNKKEDKNFYVSAKTKENIELLKEKLLQILNTKKEDKPIIKDKIKKGDVVFLVIPIDESAPKDRIILPQQNVLREILDIEGIAICLQVSEIKNTLKKIKPKLVIVDSQVFEEVNKIIPKEIPLTSFSILFANNKGNLKTLVENVKKFENLKNGDKILISEGCTHHRQCKDIGSVKLPNWIKNFTKKELIFEFSSGNTFPSELEKYSLIIHCGGCMLNNQEMKNRFLKAKEKNIPITNYGITIAYLKGILARTLEIFEEK